MFPNLREASKPKCGQRKAEDPPHVCRLVALDEGDTLLLQNICPLWVEQENICLPKDETLGAHVSEVSDLRREVVLAHPVLHRACNDNGRLLWTEHI